jgi:RNA 2',3'-cyclic 3'-phosphodiesterase
VNAATGDAVLHRLFFALWPDDATRARLAQAARQWSHRPVADDKLHMTLHFLGACSADQQACYSQAVSAVHCEAFELQLDYLGGRARSQIQWLSASHPPTALAQLVAALGEALTSCGYEAEKRRFLPHVTLSRHVRKPRIQAGLPAISWMVRDFLLVESVAVEGQVRYEVRARWPCR